MSKKNKQSQENNASPRIYCGPNIPGVATPGLIFTDAPPLLKKHMEECPALKTFVVEPKEYAQKKNAISRQGSLEQIQYHKAMEYLQNRR